MKLAIYMSVYFVSLLVTARQFNQEGQISLLSPRCCLRSLFRNDTTDSTVALKLTICPNFGYGYNYGLP